MANFQNTTFQFTTTDEIPLHISYVMTYGVDDEWVQMPENEPVQGFENQGIQFLNIASSIISRTTNGLLTIQIDPEIVNKVPFASDKASLILSVNGSNLHINIHKDGTMDSTGTFGNESVKFTPKFSRVGGLTVINCKA